VTTRELHDRIVGLTLSPRLASGLETYYRLLATWSQKINLTGLNLSEPTPEALDRLLIEPVVAAKHAPAGLVRMIDIGSGGGSPAIPFALALADVRLLMVESKTRKSVFLREVTRALEMVHVDVATARYEELLARPDLHEAHDLLTVRAVRTETRVLMSLQAFVRPGGQLFLFRSATADMPESLTPPLAWQADYPLIESLRSHLVVLQKRDFGVKSL
jgi:16S rRNA (guanine527-N7)-methyltransferase